MKTQGMQESEDRLEEHLKTIAPKGEEGAPPAPEAGTPPQEIPPQGEAVAPETPPATPPATPPGSEGTPPGGEQPPAETPSQEGASAFDIGSFNKMFGSDFADEDTLKSSLNKLNDLQEFDTLKTEREELQGKMDELKSKYEEAKGLLDPRKHFVNEEEYKRQLILQQHGQELNPALLNKIVGTDLSALSDMDVLTLGKMVANPNIRGGEPGAKDLIYRQLGVDPDLESTEWDLTTQNVVAEAALNARRELSKLKDIEVPELADFEAQRTQREQQAAQTKEQLKNSWDTVAKEMVGGFDSLKLQRQLEDGKSEIYFSYEVDEKFKGEATDLVVGYLTDRGMEPSKENVTEAQQYVQDLFWRNYGNEIVQAYGRDVEAKLIEKHNIEQDNPKPPNEAEAPEGGPDARQQDLIDYAKEGLGKARQPGDKLFG